MWVVARRLALLAAAAVLAKTITVQVWKENSTAQLQGSTVISQHGIGLVTDTNLNDVLCGCRRRIYNKFWKCLIL